MKKFLCGAVKWIIKYGPNACFDSWSLLIGPVTLAYVLNGLSGVAWPLSLGFSILALRLSFGSAADPYLRWHYAQGDENTPLVLEKAAPLQGICLMAMSVSATIWFYQHGLIGELTKVMYVGAAVFFVIGAFFELLRGKNNKYRAKVFSGVVRSAWSAWSWLVVVWLGPVAITTWWFYGNDFPGVYRWAFFLGAALAFLASLGLSAELVLVLITNLRKPRSDAIKVNKAVFRAMQVAIQFLGVVFCAALRGAEQLLPFAQVVFATATLLVWGQMVLVKTVKPKPYKPRVIYRGGRRYEMAESFDPLEDACGGSDA